MKRKHILWLHIAFWLLLTANDLWRSLSAGVFDSHNAQPVTQSLFVKYLVIELVYHVIPIVCFYSAYLLVAPRLTTRKNYIKAVLLFLLTFVMVVAYRYVMEYRFFLPVFGFDNYNGRVWSVWQFSTNILLYYFPSYFLYGLMYFFITEWYKAKNRRRELEKEKAAAELTFLRSQLNPHFLFNSINDIYSLTYQRSDEAPAALLKLSDILRYMLREGRDDTMPLQSEVKYLEDVIELQRISTKGMACINFTIEGYVGMQPIATLLLIAFVENAFKHGVLTDAANPVKINLQATDEKLDFRVHNKKNRDQKDKTPGIGLNNVRRRLELMYPGRHTLAIDQQGEFYSVNLELNLL
ncbi:MAG TPA: histidine kinase [Mucilaginibacter sp.]